MPATESPSNQHPQRHAKHPVPKTRMDAKVVVGLVIIAVVMALGFNALVPPPSIVVQSASVSYGQAGSITATAGRAGDTVLVFVVSSTGSRAIEPGSFSAGTLGAGVYTVYAYDVNDGRYSNPETFSVGKAVPIISLSAPSNYDFDGKGGAINFSIVSVRNQLRAILYVNSAPVSVTYTGSNYTTPQDPGRYVVTLTSQATQNYTGATKTVNFSIMPNLVFNASQNLTSDINVEGNITISNGVIINTNGYYIIAGGAFTNYGTLGAGFSDSGGRGQKSVNPYLKTSTNTSVANGLSFPLSYGGAGGYGGGCVSTGGSTLGSGGYYKYNGSRCVTYPATASPTAKADDSIIALWFRNGFQNYTAGAGGGGGAGTRYTQMTLISGGNGGSGSLGLYLQASTIAAGNITTSGHNGFGGASGLVGTGGGGGGGGGVLVINYGRGGYTPGTYNVIGGSGGNGSSVGGAGVNGQVIVNNYRTVPIAVCNGVCLGSNYYP